MKKLKPHTWVFADRVGLLGIVFNTWPKEVSYLVTGEESTKPVAIFKWIAIEGEDRDVRALKVSHPKYFYFLLRKYKGLTAGNL